MSPAASVTRKAAGDEGNDTDEEAKKSRVRYLSVTYSNAYHLQDAA